MTMTDVFRCCAVLVTTAALQACASLSGGGFAGNSEASSDLATIVGRLPLPDGAKVKVEQSMVVAPGEQWIGQIHIEIPQSRTAAYAFFLKRLPQAGWLHRSGVLGERSILNFSSRDRMLAVEINPGYWGGAQIILTAIPDGFAAKH